VTRDVQAPLAYALVHDGSSFRLGTEWLGKPRGGVPSGAPIGDGVVEAVGAGGNEGVAVVPAQAATWSGNEG